MAYGRALLPGLERNRHAWTFAAYALRRPAQPDLLLAGVVCASYFAATLVGLALRLPPSTPSVVWPPNSILNRQGRPSRMSGARTLPVHDRADAVKGGRNVTKYRSVHLVLFGINHEIVLVTRDALLVPNWRLRR